jgi:hypothetical protein
VSSTSSYTLSFAPEQTTTCPSTEKKNQAHTQAHKNYQKNLRWLEEKHNSIGSNVNIDLKHKINMLVE